MQLLGAKLLGTPRRRKASSSSPLWTRPHAGREPGTRQGALKSRSCITDLWIFQSLVVFRRPDDIKASIKMASATASPTLDALRSKYADYEAHCKSLGIKVSRKESEAEGGGRGRDDDDENEDARLP